MPATVSHVFTNPQADGTVTNIVRPSDWNSVHAITLNAIEALYDGTNSVSSGTLRLSNGNGVTFGLNGQTLTASVAAAGGAQTGISALYDGANSISSGTVRLTNANNVTFSINGNTLSASVHAQQTAISGLANSETTYTSGTVNLSVVGGNLTIRSTTGNALQFSASQSVQAETQTFLGAIKNTETTYTSGTVELEGTNNITVFSTTGQRLRISGANTHAQQTAISGLSATNTLYTSGTVLLTGSNMITVKSSAAGQTIVLDATQSVQTQNVVDVTLGSNTAGALALISSGTMTLAGGNNITLSQAGNAVTISGANAGGAQTAISGLANSQTTYTSGTVSLSELGAITVRSTTGQQFQFSVNSQTVQTQNMVAVTLSSNTAGALALVSSGTLTLAGGNNITLSQAGNAVTISGANAGGAQTAISGLANSQTTYTSGTVSMSELGAITIRSTTGQQFQFSVNSQTVQTQNMVAVSATNTLYSSGTVLFTGSNMITVKSSAAGQTIVLDATQSVQTQAITVDQVSVGVSTGGNTAGNTTVQTGNRLVFSGQNNITLSQATGAGSTTIGISAPSQSVQTQGITVDELSIGVSTGGNTAGNTTVNTGQRFVLVGSNGITLSQGTGANSTTVTISGITQSIQTQGITVDELSVGVSTGGNTAGNTTVQTGQRLVFSGQANITLSQATGAGSTTIGISGGAGGGFSAGASNLGNTAGATGVSGTRGVFVGTNNITLSQTTDANGFTMSISGAGGGAGQFSGGVSNLGNTAGSTGVTGTRVVFVGTNDVTLSQSTDANGATISVDDGVKSIAFWDNVYPNAANSIVIMSALPGVGTWQIQPLSAMNGNMTINTMYMKFSHSGSTATMSAGISSSWSFGLWTRNGSTLSLLNSASTSLGLAAATDNSNTFVANRWLSLHSSKWSAQPVLKNLSEYWWGWAISTAGGAWQTRSMYIINTVLSASVAHSGTIGVATVAAASSQGMQPFGAGIYGTSTSIPPTAISSNQINHSNAAAQAVPYILFVAAGPQTF